MTIKDGVVNGQMVRTLRDTGCSTVVVRKGLVEEEQFTGEKRTCALMNGMVIEEPMAKIRIDTPYVKGNSGGYVYGEPVVRLGNW